ncbi:MAG: replication initiator protein [Microvirus sp.]|nr:MAG: replication initiator protein [Microvirus sp.]
MACFSPLSAFQTDGGQVIFSERGSIRRPLQLPCGQCIGCRLERSRFWAVRCMHESQMHDFSSFVTLTYDSDNASQSLNYRDYQLFMKRLRKRLGPARFYMCGEYGEQFKRPHFHACLFGCYFHDRVVHSRSASGSTIYRSPTLEELWPEGFSSIGDVTFESAAYCARYVMKKVTGDRAEEHYKRVSLSSGELIDVVPEFSHMSNRPGIGAGWFSKYHSDVFSKGKDGVRIFDRKQKAPRAYLEYLKRLDPDLAEDIAQRRYDSITDEIVANNEPERLKVREEVTRSRLSFKLRSVG